MRLRNMLAAGLALGAGCRSAPVQSIPGPASAQSGPPSTDIYLYRLSRLLPFGDRLINITNRRGYDNQPSWDGQTILYTSARDGQTDIFRYVNGAHARVTATRESEYSAAITPDGRGISVVRVERDSTQRLWHFPTDGGAPSLILESIKPVGYYAWLDSTLIALFVLGSPNTLQIADTRSGTSRIVTSNIGRALQRVPESRRASYLRRVDSRWRLETVAPIPRSNGSFDVDTIAFLPDSAEYVVWRSPTELYTGAGSRIYRMRLPDRRWQQIAELAGLRRISRLAISPDGRTLAVVAEEP